MQYLLLLPALYLLVCVILYFAQGRLLYAPSRNWVGTPTDVGLDFEDVWLESERGQRIHAWYVPHARARGLVLFCHGNGGNNSHRLDSLALIHELGLSVLIFDYPGYGQSQGRPSQASMLAAAHAARDWLRTKGQDEDLPLVLWGRSLGGAVAALLAQEQEPAFLIVESSFPDMVSVAARLYPWLPVRLLLRDRWRAAQALSSLFCPKLFVHSLDDQLIPFALGQTLFDRAAPPKEFLPIHGGHEGGWLESGQDYSRAIGSFIQDNLQDNLDRRAGDGTSLGRSESVT